MSDYFLTYLWTWMECFSAISLFDAFSARKMERFRHWIIVTSLAFLEATFLNIASKALPDYSKILIALVLYYFVHRILYISNRFFGLYISIIIYATMCCIDNLWHTLALLLSETLNVVFLGNALCQSMLVHGIIIAVCFLQAKARNGKLSQATNFRWYTIPAVLSLASVLLIFFFGSCFQQGQISIQPLCVCATFITVMQIAALLLISWICRTHLRCAADCSTSPIQEELIQRAFLTMHNKLIVNHAQIFTPALHDLYAAQKILDDKESQRQELNQQVYLLAKKLHNLSRLREKNCITAAQYWERRNPLERELTDVKNTISKAATNHPLLRTLAQTKQLAEHYTYLKPLTEFDEYEFKFAVNRVLVDSESCTFELKNGMKFKEIY